MSKDRKSKLEPASDLLQTLLLEGKSPLSAEFGRWRLWRKWEEVVGASIAAQTEPVGIRDRVLWVWVRNSVWMHQMLFLAKPIKEKVNQFFKTNAIQMVRFTVDRREVPTLSEADDKIKDYLTQT